MEAIITANFVWLADPGHAWLKVPHDALSKLGLSPENFSPYSYLDGEAMYLEEDMDAPVFIWAAEDAGLEFGTTDKFYNVSAPCRGKRPNAQGKLDFGAFKAAWRKREGMAPAG